MDEELRVGYNTSMGMVQDLAAALGLLNMSI